MREILNGSLLWSVLRQLRDWYRQGAIAHFFRAIADSYPFSKTKHLWHRFVWAPMFGGEGSKPPVYVRIAAHFARWLERVGDCVRQSVFYRACVKIAKPVGHFVGGGVIGRVCRFFGVRGFLIMAVSLYLPIDFFLRNVVQIGFLSSLWDEMLMAVGMLYVCWRRGMYRTDRSITRATPVDAYILFFVGVAFFLMCVVSPYMGIAIDGFRAVVQYIFWFFVMIRLVEDDRDFAILYGTLVVLATLIGLHGIYQYIVAAPIPAGWVSQTEESVRTRVYSLTGSPNIMGSFLVLFAPMAAGLAYYSKKLWLRIMGIGAAGIMCLSILFTFSKGAWGGLVVAVLIFAIYLDRRLIGLMAVGGGMALIAIPSIANRITYLFTADYAAASARAGRSIRWATGYQLLLSNNKWLGFGLGRFGGAVAMQNKIIEETDTFSYFYMDNYYLKTLVEMGYIGLIAFIILLVGMSLWCLRALGRTRRTDIHPLAVAMFAGMAGVMAHCYFENIFEVPYMVAYFWTLAAGILYLGYFRKRIGPKSENG